MRISDWSSDVCSSDLRYPRINAAMLAPPRRPGAMAILIPAWDEAAVIRDMLKGALRRLDHPQYRIFVGVYPNDPDPIAAVRRVAAQPVISVFTSRPGPPPPADCLNHTRTEIGRPSCMERVCKNVKIS